MLRKKYLYSLGFSLVLLCSSSLIYAQFGINLKVHRAFVFSHTPYISGLAQQHFNIYECTFSKRPTGNKYWHIQYPNAYWGVSYCTSNLGYKQVLGNVHAIIPHFNFAIFRSKRYLFSFQLGTGIGYFTKHFNRTTNYKNLAIGSAPTLNMRGMFESKIALTSHWQWLTSFGINHFSNGAFKTPNYGINILSVCTGITYVFNTSKDTTRHRIPNNTYDSLPNKWYTCVIASVSRKQTSPAGGKNYGVGALQLSLCKQLSHKYRLGLGVEYNYNKALTRETNGSNRFEDLSRVMVGIHNEFLIHRLSIVSVTGVNVYSKANADGFIMNRLGLRYYFKNGMVANCSLKTYLGQADFFDLGIGYAF